jgi:polyisoprenoid-binding protein YceI
MKLSSAHARTASALVRTALLVALSCTAGLASAAPVTYTIDPNHTYPSFEADHMGGLSKWRGKFKSTSGTVQLDKQAQAGTIDVKIDAASLDFGHEKMNEHAKGKDIFDVAKFPTATYTGKLAKFKDGAPTEIDGQLTLHGVTKPVTLKVNSFVCKPNPMTKKEVCGADASGTINREDFGIAFGKQFGFKMDTALQIQVEASPAA